MGNKFYAPGAERAGKVHDLFAAIAPRYDLINDLQSFGLHRWWKRRMLRLARLRPGESALDLCCGTGDVALAMARTGARVVGLDFSDRMLAVARARSAQAAAHGDRPQGKPWPEQRSIPVEVERDHRLSSSNSWSRMSLTFLRGDALRTPFCDEEFDAVTISYGLRNLENCEAGLCEMLRVLRTGGRLVVLDFGKPDNALWRAGYFSYLRWLVPGFGRLFCGDSATYGYILESLRHYPAQRGVAALMKKLHCHDVRILNLLGGVMSINYGVKGRRAPTEPRLFSESPTFL